MGPDELMSYNSVEFCEEMKFRIQNAEMEQFITLSLPYGAENIWQICRKNWMKYLTKACFIHLSVAPAARCLRESRNYKKNRPWNNISNAHKYRIAWFSHEISFCLHRQECAMNSSIMSARKWILNFFFSEVIFHVIWITTFVKWHLILWNLATFACIGGDFPFYFTPQENMDHILHIIQHK